MKTRTILLTIVLIFAIPAVSEAQVGNLLKNKVGKVINAGVKVLDKEADKKIDSVATKEAQEAYDKAERDRAEQEAAQAKEADQGEQGEQAKETDQKASDKPAGGGLNLGGLMGGKVTSKYNDTYSFNNRIFTQAEMYDNKDVMKMDYYIYFNDNTQDAGFESKMEGSTEDSGEVTLASAFIYDGVNRSFIMMTDMGGMRVGVISEVPEENTAEEQAATETSKTTITKTGNTRMIAGYKCDEYKYIDNETKDNGKIWATKDLKLQADKRTFSKAGMSAYYGSKELDNSVVLGMESYNKKGELEMKSETREVNLGYKHTMSTTGYSYRQMNFNQAGQQKKK
ncbi:MAG: DUF4412 domain-containing protein [Bacteroidia bacterium]|nr:DUF4412 domain-containing protein [Bacteroidia bacterium]